MTNQEAADVVRKYISNSFDDFNTQNLRSGGEINNLILKLDEAISSFGETTSDNGLVVFRGINFPFYQWLENETSRVEKSFISATTDLDIAYESFALKNAFPLILQIEVMAGIKYIREENFLERIFKEEIENKKISLNDIPWPNNYEKEVLFPRNLKVEKIEELQNLPIPEEWSKENLKHRLGQKQARAFSVRLRK